MGLMKLTTIDDETIYIAAGYVMRIVPDPRNGSLIHAINGNVFHVTESPESVADLYRDASS